MNSHFSHMYMYMYFVVQKCYTGKEYGATIASILRKLLNEDVVENLIRHKAQPSALSGFETTPEFNNFRSILA